jgi:hypothetical protein
MKPMNRLTLSVNTSRKKPRTILPSDDPCPFCSFTSLRKEGRVLDERTDLLWIRNKFGTLKEADQTVLVETEDCGEDFSTYSPEKAVDVLGFAIGSWHSFLRKPEYQSALLFKNAGPLSGASIHHAHMQIVGLKSFDPNTDHPRSSFGGIPIFSDSTVSLRLADKPNTEFYEFNLQLKSLDSLDSFARCVQSVTDHILGVLNPRHKSFNYAFYLVDNDVHMRIFVRFPTSIFHLGYGISQTPDDIPSIAQRMKSMYF